MTVPLTIVGFDPSLRNWGIATALYWPQTNRLEATSLALIQPILPTGKQVRQNSLDLETAVQLHHGALQAAQHASVVFVEVPVGSQSARAMASYGVCVGILGSLRSGGIPFFELTPLEVKRAAVGRKTASKAEMIAWATQTYPTLNWPRHMVNGELRVSETKAEHMADALATIHAGISSNSFRQALPFLQERKTA